MDKDIRWQRSALDEIRTITWSEDILGKSRAVPSAGAWLPVLERNCPLAYEFALWKQLTKASNFQIPLQIIIYTMMQSVVPGSATDVCPTQDKQAYESFGKVWI